MGGRGRRVSLLLSQSPAAVDLDRQRCGQHLAEIGYLIDRRRLQINSGVHSWVTHAAIEQRLSLHLAALQGWGWPVSERVALAALQSRDDDTRCGAIFARASLDHERTFVGHMLGALCQDNGDDSAGPSQQAIDALALAPGDHVVSHLEQALLHAPRRLQPFLARAIGARGQGGEATLLQLLAPSGTADQATRQASARALAQLGCAAARPLLTLAARQSEFDQVEPYLFALALLGDQEVLQLVRRCVLADKPRHNWNLFLLLGIVGSPEDDQVLKRAWREGAATEAAALPLAQAMGALGTGGLVPVLIDALAHQQGSVAYAAAASLRRITAAPICQAAGEEERSNDSAAWQSWWKENGNRFAPTVRYRLGVPLREEPRRCVDELAAHTTTNPERQLAAWELQMRSSVVALPLCVDWPVARQRREIIAWQTALSSNRSRPAGRSQAPRGNVEL